MSEITVGAEGALHIDEKFHINAFTGADLKTKYLLQNTFFAIADDKGRVQRLDSGFAKSEFKKKLLGASFKLEDPSFPAKITVSALSPCCIGADAHLPAALFTFKIKNTSKKRRTYYLGALIENFLAPSLHEGLAFTEASGVQLGSATKLSVECGYLTHCLLMEGAPLTACYIEEEGPAASFMEMLSSGKLISNGCPIPSEHGYAAVMRKITVESGKSVEISAVYAWYEPNFECDGTRFKNGYVSRFDGCGMIALEVLKQKQLYLDFSKKATYAVRAVTGGKTLEYAMHDSFRSAFSMQPYKLEALGNGKRFYNNPYAAPVVYASKKHAELTDLFLYFDAECEAELLKWQLSYCKTGDGEIAPLPHMDNGTFTSAKDSSLEAQILPLLRAYRLYVYGEDLGFIRGIWSDLKQIWDCLQKKLCIYEDFLVHEGDGICNIYKSGLYLLGMMCMQKLSVLMQEQELSDTYALLAKKGKDFLQANVFNGKFYFEYYPSAAKQQNVCFLLPLVPMIIGISLGLDVVAVEQLASALENVYALNYSDADLNRCGIRLRSDADEIDESAEMLYIYALLKVGKRNLASLICKARSMRSSFDGEESPFLANALTAGGYDFAQRELRIECNGFVQLCNRTVIFAEGEQNICVQIKGAPVEISSVSGFGGLNVKRIVYQDAEFMFEHADNRFVLKSPVQLKEGEKLNIYLKK